MLKRIKSFLVNLPIIKHVNEKIKQKRIITALKSASELKYKIEESTYTEKDLIDFKTIFNKIKIDYSVLERVNRLTKISFYSTSSQEALESIRKRHYHKETISKYRGINLDPQLITFNSWFSSEESIEFFITFYTSILEKNIALEHLANKANVKKNIAVSKEEENYINSILYRLLLCDFLSLLSLLLETTYETNQWQKSSPLSEIN